MKITIREIIHEYIALITLSDVAEISAYAGKITVKPEGEKAKDIKDSERQNLIRKVVCDCIADGAHTVYTAHGKIDENGEYIVDAGDMCAVKAILDFAAHTSYVDMVPGDRLTTRFIHNLPPDLCTAYYDSEIDFVGM